MKFGQEFASQMVHEWQPAYMDYNYLKSLLEDVLKFRQKNASTSPSILGTSKAALKRRLSLYRNFSGLTSRYLSRKGVSPATKNEDEVILTSEVESQGLYQTKFLMSEDQGGEYELVFFRRLDDEFNKVVKFYKEKVDAVKTEAEELTKQMDALIALRIKEDYPLMEFMRSASNSKSSSPNSTLPSSRGTIQEMSRMDAIQEVEMTSDEGPSEVEPVLESKSDKQPNAINKNKNKLNTGGFTVPRLEVLGQVGIHVEPETPVSTLKKVFISSKPDLSFSKVEFMKAEETLKLALVEFHQKLRLLKNYSFLNLLAFSKIMKKYDKITTRNASKSYLEMVDNSCLGNSDEITRLTERVEAAFIKHFSNGNRKEGIKLLRPQAKRERHSVTFFLGLFCGCSIALVAAIIVFIHTRNLFNNAKGRDQYMENIFPLYSLFGFIALHMILYAGNMYLWRRSQVNYPFIFGFTEAKGSMGYREVLLVALGLTVLTLAAALSNLEMEMDPGTRGHETLTELVPLGLVIAVLLIAFCPLNIIYRSSRFFIIQSTWRCLCAPLYKVTLPDFFLADQFTSQVQAFRCLEFYVCYYGSGDFKRRSIRCHDNRTYQIFYIIVAVVPFWARFLQCLRRWFERRDKAHVLNGLKYLSTIVAVVIRTLYELRKGTTLKIMAAATSGFTTIFNTYWDVVMDWGLLRRDSKNPWLRDKLLLSNKKVYFAAMVVNILLRLVWMQLVLNFQGGRFIPMKALVAIVACLEILRRGIWNFFRLENEHLNNVGNYRAFKTVPLPFYFDDEKNK